ncbi:DNA helicase [Tanacetum coccineum]|uniref:ATP-dependent DNA helicase n=1 Tax=Tanacetum coccineum TaxID=301880 RepID=A0ABQ5C0T6_9ASTR
MEVIASCVSESKLWPHFKESTLKENMRLARPNISADARSLINSFASWLFDVGDGKTGQPNQQDPENTSWIDIPLNYYLPDNEEVDHDRAETEMLYPVEDVNTLKLLGCPLPRLELKVGAPVMLLRNANDAAQAQFSSSLLLQWNSQ